MAVARLGPDPAAFPPPSHATDEGLLAWGGDLQPERLLAAYSQGIFPWPHAGLPLLWFSPDPRMVLPLGRDALHVPRRLQRTMRRMPYRMTADRAFQAVVRSCATIPRTHETGTWITPDIEDAYCRLHELGYAHSVEAWRGPELVGGIYGISLGGLFCGESMFTLAPDASKLALITLIHRLETWNFLLFDAQVPTPHVARLGFREWSRKRYLATVEAAMQQPTRRGRWELEG